MQVIIRYAVRYNLLPEYTIPGTVPSTPPLWPGQRRGKHVDLADLMSFQIWEVEEYSASGNYPSGHGLSQVINYLDLLNTGTDMWMPGRYLGRERFTSGAYDVNAWWEQPGLLVYQKRINRERAVETATVLCLVGIAHLIKTLQQAQQELRELPGQLPPLPEPIPLIPPIIPIPVTIPVLIPIIP